MYIRQGALRVLYPSLGARLKPRQVTREPALHASLIIVIISETSHQATDTKSGSAIELQEKKQQKCVKVFATTKILMLRFRVAHCAMALCTLGVALSLEGAVPPPPSYTRVYRGYSLKRTFLLSRAWQEAGRLPSPKEWFLLSRGLYFLLGRTFIFAELLPIIHLR